MNPEKFSKDDQIHVRYTNRKHPHNDADQPLEAVVTEVNGAFIEAQCCFVDARIRVWGDGEVQTVHGRARQWYETGTNARVEKVNR